LLYSKITIGFLVVVLLFIASAAWGVYGKYRETEENTENILHELAKLQEREAAVKNEIKRLSSERGVEEEIREKFGFIKRGEGVIVIVDSPFQSSDEFSRQNKNTTLASVWKSIVNFFKRD